MKYEVGQHVKCILKNNTIVEGTIENWEPNEVVLLSLDGESKLIITHPADDIVLIKLFLSPQKNKIHTTSNPEITELDRKFKELQESPGGVYDDSRNKNLADLKIELHKQEREIIAKKLKNHYANQNAPVRKVKYDYPRFFQKSRPK